VFAPERLIGMANQIAHYFAPYPHAVAVDGIANHIRKFWSPPMRADIIGIVDKGGEGLDSLAIEAVKKLPPAN
jgi:formate dehydrogenase subunit delta